MIEGHKFTDYYGNMPPTLNSVLCEEGKWTSVDYDLCIVCNYPGLVKIVPSTWADCLPNLDKTAVQTAEDNGLAK